MDNSELIAELLQGVTNDVQSLKKWASQQPTTTPPDYGAELQRLNSNLEALRQQVNKSPTSPAPVVDMNLIHRQLERIEKQIQKSPEQRASEYVKWGAIASGVMAVLLIGVTWLALTWKSERDAFEVSDWKWRGVQQNDAPYATQWDDFFATDSSSTKAQEWILQREQADATREAAKKAQEQAKAMNAQADELEGKKKGKKT